PKRLRAAASSRAQMRQSKPWRSLGGANFFPAGVSATYQRNKGSRLLRGYCLDSQETTRKAMPSMISDDGSGTCATAIGGAKFFKPVMELNSSWYSGRVKFSAKLSIAILLLFTPTNSKVCI